ncbi:MAG: tagaturonate reductase [Spirochaetaceae bacterium]|jgi:tagaturonate reductase|nr:tagaturonate reductase [Spirochaetaceae bacterium]
MIELNNSYKTKDFQREISDYPVKVLQFGEGNFLRGFVDWMIHRTNQSGFFHGKVRVIQPIEQGMVDVLNKQDGLYTLISRGIDNGEIVSFSEIVSSIEKGINPYSDYRDYIKSADLPELRFIISNTTEAGISYRRGETINDAPQISYPGKLTALLYRRFTTFNGAADKGLVMIPCELIDRNGDNLKRIVFQIAEEWELGEDFTYWMTNHCDFLNTLVDRIVTGYPGEEIESLKKELQYTDNLINTAEVFYLWVIEGDSKFADEFPLKQAGCNVIWTDDMTPYRTRKVRILNGIHTMTCLPAYLYGIKTVGDCLKEENISRFISKGVYDEIIPTVDFDKNELITFAQNVMERFANPYIEHQLISITLNSVSKFKARVLPTILEYIEINNQAPQFLSFALASLLHFYSGKNEKGEIHPVSDDSEVVEKFSSLWTDLENSEINSQDLVEKILSDSSFWGQNLCRIEVLREKVLEHFTSIKKQGIRKALEDIL